MPLFACSRCNTIDNSAIAPNYWRNTIAILGEKKEQRELLCTFCESGQWHNQFERERYDEALHGPIDKVRRLLNERPRHAR